MANMRKQIVIPVGAACVGAVSAVLKYIQAKTSYDEKGLIPRGDTVTVAMAVISVIFCAAALIISWKTAKSERDSRSYAQAFPIGKGELLAIAAASAVMAAASLMAADGTVILVGRAVNFTAFLGVSTAACCALLALTAFFGRKGAEQCLFGSVPALFFCFLMATVYKEYAGKPIISEYCYECIALGSGAVAFYCSAGYTFGRANGFVNVLSHLLAIYFLVMAVPGYTDKWFMVISAAGAVIAGANLSAYLKGHDAQTEEETLVENDENEPLN